MTSSPAPTDVRAAAFARPHQRDEPARLLGLGRIYGCGQRVLDSGW